MYTPDRQINPPENNEPETVFCHKCGLEHPISNSNEVVLIDSIQYWCNKHYNERTERLNSKFNNKSL